MRVEVMSFGFKYHSAPTANFVFDVRGMKNPYHVEVLRGLDGTHKLVRDFVLASYPGGQILRAIRNSLRVLLPHGEDDVVIAIGCTGGKHRSVVVAQQIAASIMEEFTDEVTVTHRELT